MTRTLLVISFLTALLAFEIACNSSQVAPTSSGTGSTTSTGRGGTTGGSTGGSTGGTSGAKQSPGKVIGGSIKIFRKDGWTSVAGTKGYRSPLKDEIDEITLDQECGIGRNQVLHVDDDRSWTVTVWARFNGDSGEKPTDRHAQRGVMLCSNLNESKNACASPRDHLRPNNQIYVFPITSTDQLQPMQFPNDDFKPGAPVPTLTYRDASGECGTSGQVNGYCEYEKEIDVQIGDSSPRRYRAPQGLCSVTLQ